MAVVRHVVAPSNDARQGGLPETVDRVATRLAEAAGVRVVASTMEPAAPDGGHGPAERPGAGGA